jgi:arginyl-tRNA synthetase
LINDYEIDFIKKALEYPKIIQVALKNLEPHHICFYLYALAGEFHKVWHFGNESKDRRFIIENDQNLTKTRLLIPYFLKIIVESAFEIVGIKPMKKM